MSTRVVVARPAVGRDVAAEDFADLTGVEVSSIEWVPGGGLEVRFVDRISDSVAAAVVRRIVSATPGEEQLRAELEHRLVDPAGQDLLEWLTSLTHLALCLGTGQPPATEEPES